jgi:hypothetical protein
MSPYLPMTDKEIKRKTANNDIRMIFQVEAQVENFSFALDPYFLMFKTFPGLPYHAHSCFANIFQITTSIY